MVITNNQIIDYDDDGDHLLQGEVCMFARIPNQRISSREESNDYKSSRDAIISPSGDFPLELRRTLKRTNHRQISSSWDFRLQLENILSWSLI